MPENEITTTKVKDRSPNFPSISLKESIERVKMLYEADKMNGCSRESAFKHLGYSGANGASLGVLGALKQYDLIREENKRILVTENARSILLLPEGDERRIKAIKICALSPKQFKDTWELYKTEGLPSDETLKTDLVYDKGFNEKSALRFLFTFKQTLDFAGIKAGDVDETETNDKGEIDENKKQTDIHTLMRLARERKERKKEKNMTEYSIPYSNSRTAILALETPVSKKDIQFIKKYLNLLEETIDEDVKQEGQVYSPESYEGKTILTDEISKELFGVAPKK